jgi:hypothetical protein
MIEPERIEFDLPWLDCRDDLGLGRLLGRCSR